MSASSSTIRDIPILKSRDCLSRSELERRYEAMPQKQPDELGILRSRGYPGLQLAVEAVLRGEMQWGLEVLQEGIASEEHQQFAAQFKTGLKTTA